jgi:quinate dehydrogenase
MSSSPSTQPLSSIEYYVHPDLQPHHEERQFVYLAGISVMHSVSPPIHNFIAQHLNLPWTFLSQECETVERVVELFRLPSFAGGVVTMPYKASIMKHLDGIDDIAITMGAVNNVYLTADGSLRGTNTDWRGVLGSLLHSDVKGQGKPALIIGAGGASRAAVYALYAQLRCFPIYIVNRDAGEVEALQEACNRYVPLTDFGKSGLLHVTSAKQARYLPRPTFIISTVPDYEPKTPSEKIIPAILSSFLSSKPAAEEGVLLDMCYKPRITRNILLAKQFGWQTEDGTCIIGYQVEEQWRLWTNDRTSLRVPGKQARELLEHVAMESKTINPW